MSDRYSVEYDATGSTQVIDWWRDETVAKCDEVIDAKLIAFALNRLSDIERAEFILRHGGSTLSDV